MEKVVVIGSNHAGISTVNTILGQNTNQEIIVIEKNTNISFLGCGMALWIGKQIDGYEGLFYTSKEDLEAKGVKFHTETTVTEVNYDKKELIARKSDGTVFVQAYDKLVFATGSLPIRPNIPGMDLENVQFVKLFQDASQTIERLNNDAIKNVTVVGAGYIGVELAEAFKRIGKEVNLVDLQSTCLPTYYDDELTDLMKQNLLDHGINLIFNTQINEICGQEKVESIKTSTGEIKTDMVVMAIGFRPNNELGKNQLELFKNGSYLVSRKQETSQKDVYAVGDCATVYDNAIGEVNYIALATNAVRSGIVAGMNIAGVELDGIGVQGSNGISIFGLNMVSTGLTLKKALELGFDAKSVSYSDLQKPGFIKNNNEVTIKIIYDKTTRRVLGAQMASKEDISMGIHMFSLAIQEQMSIDKLKLLDIFFLPHFNQPYNYMTMCMLQAD